MVAGRVRVVFLHDAAFVARMAVYFEPYGEHPSRCIPALFPVWTLYVGGGAFDADPKNTRVLPLAFALRHLSGILYTPDLPACAKCRGYTHVIGKHFRFRRPHFRSLLAHLPARTSAFRRHQKAPEAVTRHKGDRHEIPNTPSDTVFPACFLHSAAHCALCYGKGSCAECRCGQGIRGSDGVFW